jgi:hypothetical protein
VAVRTDGHGPSPAASYLLDGSSAYSERLLQFTTTAAPSAPCP